MIEKFRADQLFMYLSKKGALTPTQLDTILSAYNGDKLEKRIALRLNRKVSGGSFVRSLRQAEYNIEACVHTLLLLQYLHILDTKKWQQLARIANLLEKVGPMNPDKVDTNFEELTGAMKEFVKEFCHTKRVIS